MEPTWMGLKSVGDMVVGNWGVNRFWLWRQEWVDDAGKSKESQWKQEGYKYWQWHIVLQARS